jgi:peptidylglycine monooxygenase
MLVVALGSQRYRVERPFGDLPLNAGIVSDVAVDRRGHVFVLLRRDPLCSPSAPGVIELAPDGSRIAAWGEEIADAHMLTVSGSGEIYVVDRDAHEVIVFDSRGHRISALGRRHQPGQPFNHPTDVAFMPDGRIVVSDGYGNALVHVFACNGEWIRSFGGSFITPHALWPAGTDRIAVADRENHRLQLIDLDGTPHDVWTGFFRPQAIWGDGAGHLYVTDSVPSLTLLSETGERLGRCRPVLNGAHGISGDAQSGALYLAEGNPSRLTRLVPLPH